MCPDNDAPLNMMSDKTSIKNNTKKGEIIANLAMTNRKLYDKNPEPRDAPSQALQSMVGRMSMT
jgi:hypothetical protein